MWSFERRTSCRFTNYSWKGVQTFVWGGGLRNCSRGFLREKYEVTWGYPRDVTRTSKMSSLSLFFFLRGKTNVEIDDTKRTSCKGSELIGESVDKNSSQWSGVDQSNLLTMFWHEVPRGRRRPYIDGSLDDTSDIVSNNFQPICWQRIKKIRKNTDM